MDTEITIKEKMYVIFLGLIWSYDILLSYFRAVIIRIPFLSEYSVPACILIILVFLGFSFKDMIKKIKLSDFLFYFAFILLFIVNYYVFRDNLSYITEGAAGFFLLILPMYFIGVSFRQEISKLVLKVLYYISVVSISAFSVYTVFIKEAAEGLEFKGDMFAAYTLLPHICMALYYGFIRRRIISFVFAGIGAVVLLFLGSRGPVLCLFIFVALSFFQILTLKKKFIFLSLAGIGYFLVSKTTLINRIMLRLYGIARNFHLSTRVFDKYFTDSITYDSGRGIIKENLLEFIRNDPLSGAGLYGDRVIADGQYAHNIVLELVTHFGVPIGLIFAAAIAFLAIKAFIRIKDDKEMLGILNIAFCLGICKLMLSGSYLLEPFFFLFIGLCVNILREKQPVPTEEAETPPPDVTEEQQVLINA